MERKKYETCLNALKEELIPAMGCTEPVAVAYAAALARDALGAIPERAEVAVSGNILKNVKSVVVPNTGGLRGVAVAVAAGIVAGDASKELEVLSAITAEEISRIAPYMQSAPIAVKESDSGCVVDIGVRVFCGADEAFVRITGRHTNVVRVEKNGEVLRSGESGEAGAETPQADFSVKDIVEFADTVALADVEETLERQIAFNGAICEEGLKTDYGARVGKILLSAFGNDVHNRAKATAAAGSVNVSLAAVGMPYFFMRFLEKTLLPSMIAAFLLGPKQGTPAASSASTQPRTSGSSGVTTAKSTFFSRANATMP